MKQQETVQHTSKIISEGARGNTRNLEIASDTVHQRTN